MQHKSFVLLVVGMVVFFLCSISSADVPHMINYQGKLTTATGGCLNDTVQMTFSIYPDTLGSPADWSETQTEVVVKEGIFSVLLGAVDTIPTAVFDGGIKYLGVQVESDPEMRPLKPMVSVAYAYRAGAVDGSPSSGWVDDGTVVRLEDSTDQVGIGTANPRPGMKLHLKDDGYAYLLFDHGRDTTWAVGSNSGDNQNLQILLVNPFGSTTMASFGVNGDIGLAVAFGKVGIGTNPKAKLDVAEYLGADLAITNTDGTIETGDLLGQLMFYGADGNDQVGAEIKSSAVEEWTPGSSGGDLRFMTTPSGSSTPVERITISDDGNVGIGTIGPTTLLTTKLSDSDTTWAGTTRQYAVEIDNVDQTDSNWAQIVFDDNDGGTNPAGFIGTRFTDHTNNYGELHFGTRGSGSVGSRMVIDSPGNIGIGTTTPAHKLDVEGYVQAYGYYTGDIIFQKEKEKLWRMFEDEDGLYLENLKTGKICRFVLQEVKKE